jgi:hypothetical protein
VKPRCKERPFDAPLAWVLKIRGIVEHVVDAVHRKVVRDEEVDGADDEDPVYLVRREEKGCGERICGVDPAHWS